MLRLAASIALIAVLAVFAAVVPSFADHTVRHATTVTVHEIRGAQGQCSAVMVAPGRAFTAAHCIKMGPKVILINGQSHEITEVYAVENTSDVAVVIAPGAPCPCATMAGASAKEGDRVITVGYPYGSARVATYGEVQAKVTNPEDEREYVMTTAPTAPGFSGGGVFDAKGRLLGINSASDARGILSLYGEVLTVFVVPTK